MSVTYIDAEHHLLRAVPWARLRKDENEKVVGIEAVAFRLREGEAYLSAAWLEYFEGDRDTQIAALVDTFRRSNMKPTAKGGFALGNAGNIRDGCYARNHKVRIIHERTDDNAAHVAVRRWPADDVILHEQMARELWAELILNKDID